MSHESNENASERVNSAKGLTSILDELDASASSQLAKNRRVDQRFNYRKTRLVAWIQQPGDVEPKQYNVIPRNLGEGGISFLHGGFVHVNSKVTVQLTTLHGTWRDIEGLVESCRFVRGKLHEVDVRFLHSVQPSEYCTDAVHPRVLLIDDDPSIVRLARVLLEKLNADVQYADNGRAGVEMALSQTFDLIMIDVEMPVLDGLSATRELRLKGYSGKIIAATARTQPEDHQACLEAGCDDYFPKPYNKEGLARLVESVNREPVFSTLSDDPAMTEVINAFIAELPNRIRELEEATKEGDAKALEVLARRMKGEGSMYGFEIITDLAGSLESMLMQECAIASAKNKVGELVQLCMQVRSTVVCNTARISDSGDE